MKTTDNTQTQANNSKQELTQTERNTVTKETITVSEITRNFINCYRKLDELFDMTRNAIKKRYPKQGADFITDMMSDFGYNQNHLNLQKAILNMIKESVEERMGEEAGEI